MGLIVALWSVRVLLQGSYFTVPLTPLIVVRSSQLAEVTRVPAIQRLYRVYARVCCGRANNAMNSAAIAA